MATRLNLKLLPSDQDFNLELAQIAQIKERLKTYKTVYLETQGCQMNSYDSSRMVDLLASINITLTDSEERADILILNSCSIREKAHEKLFSKLGRWRKLKHNNKKNNRNTLICVGGCVPQVEPDLLKRAPYVDVVFGPQTLHRLPKLLYDALGHHKPAVDLSFPEIEKFDKLPEPRVDGCTALVSIMEGCSKYCSYCIVPYTRGEEISRDFESVLTECLILSQKGVREITLLGQNVNDYQGKIDINNKNNNINNIADLALLIEYLAEIKGLDRLRFTTSHPTAFSDRLIEAYRNIPKLANHLHLPVQSGSNRILSLMKRGYTIEEYIDKINKLKNIRPNISVTSDFIIGFPTETEQDFQNTLDLVDLIQFDHSYCFIYSPRPGTPAALLDDPISLEIKKQRLKILLDKIEQNAQKITQSMVNSHQVILIEKIETRDDHQFLMGKTENNRPVLVKNNNININNFIGQFIKVKILSSAAFPLYGEFLEVIG